MCNEAEHYLIIEAVVSEPSAKRGVCSCRLEEPSPARRRAEQPDQKRWEDFMITSAFSVPGSPLRS